MNQILLKYYTKIGLPPASLLAADFTLQTLDDNGDYSDDCDRSDNGDYSDDDNDDNESHVIIKAPHI